MGITSSISSFFTKIFGQKPKKIMMVGLDAAGKTSILYKLKLGEAIPTTPTIGFNLETVKFQNLTFNLWDIGGNDKTRYLWNHYLAGNHAVIFVFDSQSRDQERNEFAAEELHTLSSRIAGDDIPLLIFANKQDCEGALSIEEIEKILHPYDLKQSNWHIQLCSAKTADGITQGFEWIGNIIRSK